jgi:gliding motility-associated-like protein
VRVLAATAGANQTFCASTQPIALTGTPAGGTWTGPGVSGSVAAGFVFTPLATLAGANALTYSVSDPAVTCVATSTRIITVIVSPAITLAPLPVQCASNTTLQPLVASPAGGTWTGTGVVSSGGYFFRPSTGPGTYQLVYNYTSNGCLSQTPLLVTVVAPPVIVAGADTTLCPGATQPLRLRGASPAGGTWTGPGVSGSVQTGFFYTPVVGGGTSTLTYTVANTGCTSTGTRRISVATVPPFAPIGMPAACPEDRQAPLSVQFSNPAATGSNLPLISWDFGDSTAVVAAPSTQHTYTRVGRYQPRATLYYNNNLCTVSQLLPVIEVKSEQIPNIITPNGDSKNQFFRLPTTCPPRIQVFSRWGQRVFEAAAYQNNWDATGEPSGIYYYLLEYPDGHRVRGWVEVVKE